MVWKPRVTVAVIAPRQDRFLMVEENIRGQARFNQPAGHLEDGESLIEAAIRECREETAWRFEPESLVGVYRWRHPRKQETYLRFTFAGACTDHLPDLPLDEGILAAHWLTLAEIRGIETRLRNPLVLRSLNDYLKGVRYPLELLVDLPQELGV